MIRDASDADAHYGIGATDWDESPGDAEPFMYEDELPADITDAEYDEWYAQSWVEGVRMGPVFKRPGITWSGMGEGVDE